MLLAVNIENKNVHLGLFDKSLVQKFKINTKDNTTDEIKLKLKLMLSPYTLEDIDASVISSVVPDMTKKYVEILKNPIVVGAGIKTGLNIKCESPKDVGSDRIIRAAYRTTGKNLIINLDEVITIDFTDENNFMGGMIIPGMNMALENLKEMAKLPKVEIIKTDYLIGNSTTKAIQSGLYTHYKSTISSVIKSMRAKYKDINIIATGQHSEFLLDGEIERVEIVKDLELYGLEKIYRLNQK